MEGEDREKPAAVRHYELSVSPAMLYKNLPQAVGASSPPLLMNPREVTSEYEIIDSLQRLTTGICAWSFCGTLGTIAYPLKTVECSKQTGATGREERQQVMVPLMVSPAPRTWRG